ncbi:hypothetical protein MiSe_40880 [Microseira wollei NIES-4236]|uniref:Uncharacterized protein n=1 Tax=Microseira wollei NIES-4236 TaxID=2530354 RepID=A0AAV3WIJ3_9CYAN|nr:hypothetical protein MiSe_40880 [Microseira wollei NIES-4236]
MARAPHLLRLIFMTKLPDRSKMTYLFFSLHPGSCAWSGAVLCSKRAPYIYYIYYPENNFTENSYTVFSGLHALILY